MNRRALLSVNLAVLLFGLAGLFAKWINIPAIGITFRRVLFSSLALLVFLLARRQSIRLMGKPISNPDFLPMVKKWRRGEITASEAMRRLGMAPTTFYRKVRRESL